MSRVEIVYINGNSDGDANHIPNPAWTIVDPPYVYLEKLASAWRAAQGQQPSPGVKYYLDQLPDGYRLYEKRRINTPSHIDRHLFGHPKRKYFDSANRFVPHFLHLMENGDPGNCPCTICCTPNRNVIPLPLRSGLPQVQQVASLPTSQSTPTPERYVWQEDFTRVDTLQRLIDELQERGHYENVYEEPLNMDWRSERKSLPRWMNHLCNQNAWVPRVGELVLFVRELKGAEISLDTRTRTFKVFDSVAGEFAGYPRWEAGVVAQSSGTSLSILDLLKETDTSVNITISGFRVEPLPMPGDDDKTKSKKYKYVPLHFVRPFVFWSEFHRGIEPQNWHTTIWNALTVMSSWSVANKFYFKGVWPSANLFCRGAYLGSELIVVGDAIRVLPTQDDEDPFSVVEVLQVTDIVLQLDDLDKANNHDYDDGQRSRNSTLFFYGKPFTNKSRYAYPGTMPLSPTENLQHLPSGMRGYEWHYAEDPKKYLKVPFNLVMGRCYEAEAMVLWFPTHANNANDSEETAMSLGLEGLRLARGYAVKHDVRIPTGKNFFWANSRGEALDITELNGMALSRHDAERDEELLENWQDAANRLHINEKNGGLRGTAFRGRVRGRGRPRSRRGQSRVMAPFNPDDVASDMQDKDNQHDPRALETDPYEDDDYEILVDQESDEIEEFSVSSNEDVGALQQPHGQMSGASLPQKDAVETSRRDKLAENGSSYDPTSDRANSITLAMDRRPLGESITDVERRSSADSMSSANQQAETERVSRQFGISGSPLKNPGVNTTGALRANNISGKEGLVNSIRTAQNRGTSPHSGVTLDSSSRKRGFSEGLPSISVGARAHEQVMGHGKGHMNTSGATNTAAGKRARTADTE